MQHGENSDAPGTIPGVGAALNAAEARLAHPRGRNEVEDGRAVASGATLPRGSDRGRGWSLALRQSRMLRLPKRGDCVEKLLVIGR